MFTRPEPVAPVAVTAISQPTPPQPRVNWARLARRGIALTLVSVGAYAMFADSQHVVSENAVISSHLVSLRAPVGGVITDAVGTMGHIIDAGDRLAVVNNSRADERPQANAELNLRRLVAERAASEMERETLGALLADLTGRAEKYRIAVTARLELQSINLQSQIAARRASLDQARRELQRKEALLGTVAKADIERAQSSVDVLSQEINALAQALASADGVARSAAEGVLAEPSGSNDVAYSQQRADEVRLRLADLDRAIMVLSAAITEFRDRLAVETRILDRERAAVIKAPGNGMVWRVSAGNGERVAAGEELLQVVECGNIFLAVAVPQNRLPEIELGSTATFRLSGETADQKGIVRGVTGASAMQSEARLAATPHPGNKPTGLVLIELPPQSVAAGACPVGRTAHVLLPAVGGSWLTRAKDWVPGLETLTRLASSVFRSANAATTH